MSRANRRAALAAVLGAAALVGSGCGAPSCSSVTPDLSYAPGSCSFAPNTSVAVSVRWCDCGAATTRVMAPDWEASGVLVDAGQAGAPPIPPADQVGFSVGAAVVTVEPRTAVVIRRSLP